MDFAIGVSKGKRHSAACRRLASFACASAESCHSRVLMTASAARSASLVYSHRHILGIEGLSPAEITGLLDLSDSYVEQNRRADKKGPRVLPRLVIHPLLETLT